MNLLLTTLKPRGLIDLQGGLGPPFIAPGFRLSPGGWLECERLHFDQDAPPQKAEQAVIPSASAVRIFISHSSDDETLAACLVDFIHAGIRIPSDEAIRCTSVPGYKLEGGDDTAERLRAEIKGCAVVLGLLTRAAAASSYVLLELGAAWGLEKKAIPLLAPGVPFKILGPLAEIHTLQMADDTDMITVVTTLARATGFDETPNRARLQAALRAFVAEASKGDTATHAPAPAATSEVAQPTPGPDP
jgi:hypothetical protein